MHNTILAPAVLLAAWTSVLLWGPSLFALIVIVLTGTARSQYEGRPPSIESGVRKTGTWIRYDTARLLDAPVIFYVLSFALAMTHRASDFDSYVAWCYALLRIAYSLSWITRATDPIRIVLFFTSAGLQQVLMIRCLLDVLAM
ncbi:MAPEG family protein [Paraburkholderia humisilvae]|uniref:MAPEG family protein n=1 Tax=Paraburkholderia humisilvae TaxID=627669 RepID=A0A6J5EUD4_9BURK|nr:MAPEG family protein [Paraburkholderia humisilvae]CAB3769584.1 hypothetical protein LMG29542_06151 [Paraburkholderia humisilvae]